MTPKQAIHAAVMIASHLEGKDLCGQVHHRAGERHKPDEACPATIRLLDAAYRLCEWVKEKANGK